MITPNCDINRWAIDNCNVVLANAEYYYTKGQVEKLIDSVSGVTMDEVDAEIDWKIRKKADKDDVYTKEQTNSLLASYMTKLEAKSHFHNYAKVENGILTLNNENL